MTDSFVKFIQSQFGGQVSPDVIALAINAYISTHPIEYTHPSTHLATMIEQDSTHRFTTDAEKLTWDNKIDTTDERLIDARDPLTHSHSQSDITDLATDISGKQTVLVSGTNIKTINSTSLLGSGNIVISGSGLSQAQVLTRQL
jgi:hypothetical protein